MSTLLEGITEGAQSTNHPRTVGSVKSFMPTLSTLSCVSSARLIHRQSRCLLKRRMWVSQAWLRAMLPRK